MDKQNIIVAFLRVKKYFHEGSRLHQIILNMRNNRRSLKKTIFDCSVEADNILEILQDAIDLFIDEYSESDSDNEESSESESDNEESSESDNEESYEKLKPKKISKKEVIKELNRKTKKYYLKR